MFIKNNFLILIILIILLLKQNIGLLGKIKLIFNNNTLGCCYSISFGTNMSYNYNNYKSLIRDNCKIQKRFGGKTVFEDQDCKKLILLHKKNN